MNNTECTTYRNRMVYVDTGSSVPRHRISNGSCMQHASITGSWTVDQSTTTKEQATGGGPSIVAAHRIECPALVICWDCPCPRPANHRNGCEPSWQAQAMALRKGDTQFCPARVAGRDRPPVWGSTAPRKPEGFDRSVVRVRAR